jgi:hypothetical protein
MKQKHLLVTGILGIILIFTLMLTACPLDDGSDDDGNEQTLPDGNTDDDTDDGTDWLLPSSEGTNEVSGKTWFTGDIKIDYTAAGTYTRYATKRNWGQGNDYILDGNGHFTYSPIQTGSYSWNAAKKIITHKIKTTVFRGDITSTVLLNKKEYKKAYIAYFDKQWSGWHNWFNGDKTAEDAFINSFADNDFSAWMADYCFSSDGASLLMQEALPDNVPPDQFSGQIYMPANYMDSRYEFAFDGTYAFWKIYSQKDTINETGVFAYNGQSQNQDIFLRPLTIEGKTLNEYYDSIDLVNSGHRFESDAAYKAADANNQFRMRQYNYSPVAKTIDY